MITISIIEAIGLFSTTAMTTLFCHSGRLIWFSFNDKSFAPNSDFFKVPQTIRASKDGFAAAALARLNLQKPTYLFVTQVVHPRGHVHGELEQLLGGEGGGSAVLLGKCGVRLQHSALPQEVQQVAVRGVFDGYVQVACKTQALAI